MTYNKTILYFVQITLKWPCYFILYLMVYFQKRWKEKKYFFLSCLSYESKNTTVRLCCNVKTVPFLLAVCNNFYLLTSTPPHFRSALSRTILNSFIKNFHLLFIVALICNNAVAFFEIWHFLCFTFIFDIFNL